MATPKLIHDTLTIVVVGVFPVALSAALSSRPSPIFGSVWGVGLAVLVLGGTLTVGYFLMRLD